MKPSDWFKPSNIPTNTAKFVPLDGSPVKTRYVKLIDKFEKRFFFFHFLPKRKRFAIIEKTFDAKCNFQFFLFFLNR